MNLAAYLVELKARGFDYLSDARATIIANAAKNDFEDFWHGWPWLQTTVTGTAPLTLTRPKHILYVVDTDNDRKLIGTDPRTLTDYDDDIATAGTPSHWWLDGETTLKVYPTSTVNLSVRVAQYSAELTGTDTPGIPTRYHPLWVDLGCVRAYLDNDNFQAANALKAQTQEQLWQLVGQYEKRNMANSEFQAVQFQSEDW